MIRYYKLFDLLNRKGMKKTDLLGTISAPTLAKLSKGQNVQTDVIDKICLLLNCQPGDIMEVAQEEIISHGSVDLVKTEMESVNVDDEEFIITDTSITSYVIDEESQRDYIEEVTNSTKG